MAIILNNPTSKPASYVDVSTNQFTSNIVRLVEDPDIPKTIRFDEMSLPDIPDPRDVQGGKTKIDELGLVYPMIRINDVILARQNIMSMRISLDGFMPTISLSLVFEDAAFTGKNMPKDGDMISIYIRTSTAALTYLRDDFIITSCNTYNKANREIGSRVTINGRLFIHGFDSQIGTSAITGSSKYVMKEISRHYGIGFATNDFDDTDDFMNWIQVRTTAEKYINEIVRHAWKNETSFYKCWIDLYYNLCYVNINKFLLSTENEEDVDLTFASNILNMYNQLNNDPSVENAQMTVKLLTNVADFQNTPFYISKWNPVNNSSLISLSAGYSTTSYTYMHNQNLINNGDWNCFEILMNIPAYDQSKVDERMILRGRNTYDVRTNPEDELARVNYNFIGTYERADWTGIEYVMSDDDKTKSSNKWSGNVHKNYNRAPAHNAQNINELNKIYLDVTCTGLNLQIMKGERVPVLLTFNNSLENASYNHATQTDEPRTMHRFYSGYYIVDSVEYIYKPVSGEAVSNYSTHFILKRREWPTPEIIEKPSNNENGNSGSNT